MISPKDEEPRPNAGFLLVEQRDLPNLAAAVENDLGISDEGHPSILIRPGQIDCLNTTRHFWFCQTDFRSV